MMIQVPSFRTGMRGYDPREVDGAIRSMADTATRMQAQIDALHAEVARLQVENRQLAQDSDAHRERVLELETTQAAAAAAAAEKQETDPTLIDIGEKCNRIFATLDQEVRQIRSDALSESRQLVHDAGRDATTTRQDADAYAAEMRTSSEQEATRLVTDAEAKATRVVSSADASAQAIAADAKAAYDRQRAQMASDLAEFEQSLVDRRDQSELEFANRAKEQEASIAGAQQLRAEIEADTERYRQARQTEADGLIKAAEAEARKVVRQSEITAEQTRREAERDLQATIARRDAISAQMVSLRQMLVSSLPGASPIDASVAKAQEPALIGDAQPKPVANPQPVAAAKPEPKPTPTPTPKQAVQEPMPDVFRAAKPAPKPAAAPKADQDEPVTAQMKAIQDEPVTTQIRAVPQDVKPVVEGVANDAKPQAGVKPATKATTQPAPESVDLALVSTPASGRGRPDFVANDVAEPADNQVTEDDGLADGQDFGDYSGEPFLIDTIMQIAEEGERERRNRRRTTK